MSKACFLTQFMTNCWQNASSSWSQDHQERLQGRRDPLWRCCWNLSKQDQSAFHGGEGIIWEHDANSASLWCYCFLLQAQVIWLDAWSWLSGRILSTSSWNRSGCAKAFFAQNDHGSATSKWRFEGWNQQVEWWGEHGKKWWNKQCPRCNRQQQRKPEPWF